MIKRLHGNKWYSLFFYINKELRMKSYCLKIVSMLTWLITGLYALNAGLKQLGWFDFFAMSSVASNAHTLMVLHYIIGVAGAISLIVLVLSLLHRGGCCSDAKCCNDCKKTEGGVCSCCGKSPCTCK